jgi:hypothetical protein
VLTAAPVFTREAEQLLRARGHFNWSTVTLLALVVYVYAAEVERSNWSAILAGVTFWLMNWFNEIVTRWSFISMVKRRYGRSPAPAATSS